MGAKDQINLTQIIIAIIIGLAIVGYGYINYLGKQSEIEIKQQELDSQKLELQKKESETADKENKYKQCVFAADMELSTVWEAACKQLKRGENCRLDTIEAEGYNKTHKESLDRCVQLYK